MKIILFVFCALLAASLKGQAVFDFENRDLSGWTQYPPKRWDIDSVNSLSGKYSMHHAFDNSERGRDRASFPCPLVLTDTSIVWRFQVRHGYNPSGSNNWGFFLTSDAEAGEMHPSGGASGYLLGVNYSGSDDAVKLWKIVSGSGYEILNTQFNWQENIPNERVVGFEILRNRQNTWIVKIDTSGGFDQLFEIGCTKDSSYLSSGFSGIYYEYTSSADRFLWVDDIYIGKPIPDTLPPEISSFRVEQGTALDIEFSEPMDSLTVSDASHFRLLNDHIHIRDIQINHTPTDQAKLFFTDSLPHALNISLYVTGLKDISGNTMNDTSITFQYRKLMVDTLIVSSTDTLVIFFTRAVDPETAIDKSFYSLTPDTIAPDSLIFPPQHRDRVLLIPDKSFRPDTWYHLDVKGVKDAYGDGMLPFSGDFFITRAQLFDVVINEIMADPYPPAKLPEAEYIELYNRTGEEVDLTDWTLRIDETQKPLPSSVIPPSQYVVLCDEEYSDAFNLYGNVVSFPVFPVLRNSYADITLFSDKGLLMDSVSYHESWYQDEEKDAGGYSLERIDPANHCSGMTNWKASLDQIGGTPGEKNSVFSENIDTIPPDICLFEKVTDYQLRVRFSEPVAADIADDVGNYFVSGGLGHPYSVVLKAPVNKEVLLLFTEHMKPDRSYELKIDRIADYCNNFSEGMSRSFIYHPGLPYDIVINEIMADPEPSMGLPVAEYVELYNNCDYEISLNGWKLVLGRSSVTLENLSLAPGDYCILCDSEFEEAFSGYGRVWGTDRFPVISNSGKAILLEDASGEIISFIDFTDGWYGDEYKKEGGWALEQIDPGNPCSGIDNWAASKAKAGGTPGRENSIASDNADENSIKPLHVSVMDSINILIHFNEPYDRVSVLNPGLYHISGMGKPRAVYTQPPEFSTLKLTLSQPLQQRTLYTLSIRGGMADCAGNELETNVSLAFQIPEAPSAGDLVINELLFNPLYDGADFVEVYNRSKHAIDLKDVCLSTIDDRDEEPARFKCIQSPGRLLFPGQYMVYTADPQKILEQYHVAYPTRFVITTGFPSYPDDAGTVLLINISGEVIDRFDYDEDMHFPLLKDTEGVTLERINPHRSSDDKTNWQSASHTSGYGTPTSQNSQFSEELAASSNISVKPGVFSPDNDGRDDQVDIHYRFDQPGNVLTAHIYDSRGRLVRQLINSQTVDTKGFFSWDGMNDEGRKAKMGIYVIYVEVYNLEGKVRSYKVSCVLAGRL